MRALRQDYEDAEKLKNTSETAFRAEVEVGLTGKNTAISNLQAKSTFWKKTPETTSKRSDVELSSKLDVDVTISSVC